MAIVRILLDPNATSYTDDEIVGKVNSAAVNISRASSVLAAARPIEVGEVGETELEHEAYLAAEKTKLAGVEESAKDDQTGAEIRDAVVALPDLDRKIVVTDPQVTEFKVIAVQADVDGKIAIDKNDVAEV